MDCIGFSIFKSGPRRRWTPLIGLAVLVCALNAVAAPAPRRTAPAAPKPAPDGQRYLFVVDISADMHATDAELRSGAEATDRDALTERDVVAVRYGETGNAAERMVWAPPV